MCREGLHSFGGMTHLSVEKFFVFPWETGFVPALFAATFVPGPRRLDLLHVFFLLPPELGWLHSFSFSSSTALSNISSKVSASP